jgi:hypothetical protein
MIAERRRVSLEFLKCPQRHYERCDEHDRDGDNAEVEAGRQVTAYKDQGG